MSYITSNQGFSSESSNSSQTRTLAQVLKQRDVENPSFESGNRPTVSQSLYFVNYSGVNAEIFVYKGLVQWGEVLNTSPYHHASVQAFGGVDVIPVQNFFEVAMSLYYQRQSNHSSNEIIDRPKRFALAGYGTYDVTISNRNIVSVEQTQPVKGQEPCTFYFNMKSNDTDFDWKIQMYCDNQLVQTIKSTEYKDETPQWVQSTENLNFNFPTKKIIIRIPEPFTVFLVKESDIPLDTEVLDQQPQKRWAAFGPRSIMKPGQAWLGTQENTSNNTSLVSIVQAEQILKVQPQAQKTPMTSQTFSASNSF